MDLFSTLKHNAHRLVARSCPKCHRNDADFPPEQRIPNRVLQKLVHLEDVRYIRADGSWYSRRMIVTDMCLEFSCPACGYRWRKVTRTEDPVPQPRIHETVIKVVDALHEREHLLERLGRLRATGALTDEECTRLRWKFLLL